jgi:hypothetical protein
MVATCMTSAFGYRSRIAISTSRYGFLCHSAICLIGPVSLFSGRNLIPLYNALGAQNLLSFTSMVRRHRSSYPLEARLRATQPDRYR